MTGTATSPQELASQLKSGKKIELIDGRTPVECSEINVAVAQNVPLDQLDLAALTHTRDGSGADPLHMVCRSGSGGQQACDKFRQAGFANTINVEGGAFACVDAGIPAVRVKKAISLEQQVRIAAGSVVVLGADLGWLVYPGFMGFRRSSELGWYSRESPIPAAWQ